MSIERRYHVPVTGRRALLLGGIATMAAVPLPADVAISVDVAKGRCVIPVLLDGRMARMVLDTGAERTVMNRAAAARLGLRRDLWVDTHMVGAGGLLETYPNVDASSATAGGVALFQILPDAPLSLSVTNLDLGDADGLLGSDMLRHRVLDLNIPKAQLVLRPADALVPAAGAVPLQPWARGLLLAPVRVDGEELTALVDTGASATLINARGLYKLGITPARTVRDPVVAMAGLGGNSKAHLHRFKTLQFGQLTVPDPLLLSAPVPEAAFDLILGLDVLGRQRLLLSYLSLKLSFGPA